MAHLIDLAARPNVSLQIIPIELGVHAGRDGSFTVLSYPSLGEADIAYLEHGFGSMQIEKEEEVKVARVAFDHLADLALDEQDSIALIKRVAAEI